MARPDGIVYLGRHPFDQACRGLGAEHRLIPPYCPQTNGMLECFNGWIAEPLRSTRFRATAELATA